MQPQTIFRRALQRLDSAPGDADSARFVHYGCGFRAPPTWRNFDASPTLRFERLPLIGGLYTRNGARFPANVEYGDVVRGLPVAPGSARAVYASHVLEHLAFDDLRTALANTFALLEPGGVFRLVVPDLEALAQRYLADARPDAALEFMRATGLGYEVRARGVPGWLRQLLGNSAHLWMWDFRSLADVLHAEGFREIRRCAFGDSAEPRIADVENADRLIEAVAIECRRPRAGA
jgi:hypothetical protein